MRGINFPAEKNAPATKMTGGMHRFTQAIRMTWKVIRPCPRKGGSPLFPQNPERRAMKRAAGLLCSPRGGGCRRMFAVCHPTQP